ncbi:MAG TPA: tetratricopeptide repeat protein [Armatimonadetes bacterium]|nr:tetratricopeptide repeat protein [Armatimonadota bacterium]
MKTLALLLLISAGSLAVTVERPELRAVRRRRRLASLAVALLILAALLYPDYLRWRRAGYDQGAVELLRSLHKAEVQHHKAHGTYLPLDKMKAAGLSPVEEGGIFEGYSYTSSASDKGYTIVARPTWPDGQSYTLDTSGYLNRPAPEKRAKTPEEKLALAREAAEKAPQDATAWVRLSEALAVTGRYAEALSAARRAWNLNPTAARRVLCDALIYRGGELLELGKPREALPLLVESTRLEENDADALALLGDAYRALGRETEALQSYRKATRSGLSSARAWLGLAQMLEARGEVKEAAQAYLYVVDIGDETHAPDAWVHEASTALKRIHGREDARQR